MRSKIRWEGKKLKDEEKNKRKAERRIEAHEKDVIVYTDGSALEGWKNGGAGVVVMGVKEREGELMIKKYCLLDPSAHYFRPRCKQSTQHWNGCTRRGQSG